MKSTHALDAAIARVAQEGRVKETGRPADPVAMPADISEKDFQAAILFLARREGWHCYHTFDSRRSAGGFPDLLCVRGEVIFVAELKTTTGKMTEQQLVWLAAFLRAGVPAYQWRPENWPDIVAVLTARPA